MVQRAQFVYTGIGWYRELSSCIQVEHGAESSVRVYRYRMVQRAQFVYTGIGWCRGLSSCIQV